LRTADSDIAGKASSQRGLIVGELINTAFFEFIIGNRGE
jgi:hypothetical protein